MQQPRKPKQLQKKPAKPADSGPKSPDRTGQQLTPSGPRTGRKRERRAKAGKEQEKERIGDRAIEIRRIFDEIEKQTGRRTGQRENRRRTLSRGGREKKGRGGASWWL